MIITQYYVLIGGLEPLNYRMKPLIL
jgi:hypothetical protein